MRGWRPALRLAWRDVTRSKGRSLLVLALITLPVLAITAAAVLQATAQVSGVDAIPRTMGAAQARVHAVGGSVLQQPDPTSGGFVVEGTGAAPARADLLDVLGERDVITIADGFAQVPLGDRRVDAVPMEVDLRDPLAEGLFELQSGDLPAWSGQVVINDALAERGVAIGDSLDVLGESVTVVGIGRDATYRDSPTITGPPGTFGDALTGDEVSSEWLVGGEPLLWSDVLDLNSRGALVFSRAVITDPPDVEDVSAQMGYDDESSTYITVAALVVAMALLEVVLLAGPAFAVGARRQARTLALIAASGGTPRQARRVVLGAGIVLGTIAALVGAVAGVLLGLGLVPLVQRFSGVWFGPVEVNWLVVAIVAAFGLLSAFLAALVPAWLASRQDVVAVLAGRRGDPPPSARTPVLGFVLLGVGVALSVIGVKGGELAIAFGAVISVLGMVFVVPLVVGVVGRLARRLPLVMRYAVRDAARHRTRTVPAVAAVAATVAGVVALGIANSSDEAENRATYAAELAMGTGVVTIYTTSEMDGTTITPTDREWSEVESLVRGRVDDGDMEVVQGVQQDGADGSHLSMEFLAPGSKRGDILLGSWGGRLGSVIVADAAPDLLGLDDDERTTATRALAAGRAVVFSDAPVSADEVRVRAETWSPESEEVESDTFSLPAVYVQPGAGTAPVQAVLPAELAEELGAEVSTAGISVGTSLSPDAEQDLREELDGVVDNAALYVERGYQAPDEVFILLLILFTLGAVLMLGGTLTATFLALADAKPDLATLAAVGAAPRARRGVAASYALMVGVIGAVLGTIVGFIPGVAITYPLTSMGSGVCEARNNGPLVCESGPYLDIPWLMILGLVVVLPLLTAAIVGLTARSRLPLAARLT